MQLERNTGLVLEGGGMRGVFTSGVLDAFMKHDCYFRLSPKSQLKTFFILQRNVYLCTHET